MTKAVMSAMIRPLVEPRLPEWVEPLWFSSKDEALRLAPEAEIGWFDLNETAPMVEIAQAHGIDMPVLSRMVELIHDIEDGRRAQSEDLPDLLVPLCA